MDNITPKDSVETTALGIGKRITVAISIVVSTALTLCGALGGVGWLTENLPLLGTGLGSLVAGGLASYVAVRRMRLAAMANKAGLLALLLFPLLMLSGCVAIRADSDATGAGVWAFGVGADSSAKLANVAVTGPATNEQTGVSFDSASGEQQSYQAIQSLIRLGAALAPVLAGAPPASAAASAVSASSADDTSSDPADPSDPSDDSASYSTDGYGGSPGASGEGVYGRPSCSRCRAYKAAHPDVQIINLDTAGYRSDLWAALRLRGYTGSSVALPVIITATAYTQAAK